MKSDATSDATPRSSSGGRLAGLSACALAAVLAATPMAANAGGPPQVHAIVTPNWATGLVNPRGLKFGPDGYLYVAEGGVGGANPAPPGCDPVVPFIGPYLGANTGSQISRIDALGHVEPWVVGFPSSQTSDPSGKLVSGVADVAFVGDTMYAILAGAGCSHGVTNLPNGVVRVNPDRSYTLIADLSAYQRSHPTAVIEEDDFEPDGTWYSMIAVRGDLYAVEPNHGEIVKVTTDGAISRVADVSKTQGHVVPTALAYHGNFYVGNLGTFPQDIGSAGVRKVTPSGQVKVDTLGFDMILGLAFDGRARMYVLEMAAESPAPGPFLGRVTRVSPSGDREILADGLMLPTGMTFGPDGSLYVSTAGFLLPPVGLGSITKIELLD